MYALRDVLLHGRVCFQAQSHVATHTAPNVLTPTATVAGIFRSTIPCLRDHAGTLSHILHRRGWTADLHLGVCAHPGYAICNLTREQPMKGSIILTKSFEDSSTAGITIWMSQHLLQSVCSCRSHTHTCAQTEPLCGHDATDMTYWRKCSASLVRWRGSTLLSHVRLGEQVCELLQRAGLELGLLPELGGQEAIRVLKGGKRGLDEVAEGACVAAGRGVAVLDARHLENLLRRARRNDTCTAPPRTRQASCATRQQRCSRHLNTRGIRLKVALKANTGTACTSPAQSGASHSTRCCAAGAAVGDTRRQSPAQAHCNHGSLISGCASIRLPTTPLLQRQFTHFTGPRGRGPNPRTTPSSAVDSTTGKTSDTVPLAGADRRRATAGRPRAACSRLDGRPSLSRRS